MTTILLPSIIIIVAHALAQGENRLTRREQIGEDFSSFFLSIFHRQPHIYTVHPSSSHAYSLFVCFGVIFSSQGMAKYSGITSKQLLPIVHVLAILVLVILIVWNYYFRGGFGLSGNAVFNVSACSLSLSLYRVFLCSIFFSFSFSGLCF